MRPEVACKSSSHDDDDQAPSVAVVKCLHRVLVLSRFKLGTGCAAAECPRGPGELAEPGEGEGEREPAAGRTVRIV